MLTPTKFENNDSNSRDSNSQKQRASLKSIKRTLKPRGSPYSKGDSLHEKMENAKIENKEARLVLLSVDVSFCYHVLYNQQEDN